MGRNIEIYIGDMVIKSKNDASFMGNVKEIVDNFRKMHMKLNPEKRLLGVEEGKFMGHMIRGEGIRVIPTKIDSIMQLRSRKTIKDA